MKNTSMSILSDVFNSLISSLARDGSFWALVKSELADMDVIGLTFLLV